MPAYRPESLACGSLTMAVALAMTGCAGSSSGGQDLSQAPDTPTPEVTVTQTVTPTPSQTPTPTLTPTPTTWSEIYNQVHSGVALIRTESCEFSTSRGSGYLLGPNLIATAAHVVEDSPRADDGTIDDRQDFPYAINVRLGNQHTKAEIIGYNRYADFALLRTESTLAGHIFDISKTKPEPGLELAVLGFPVDDSGDWDAADSAEVEFDEGEIAALDQTVNYSETWKVPGTIRTWARINGGNSGGPAVNMHQEVVGTLIAANSPTSVPDGTDIPSYIVPAKRMQQALNSWTHNPTRISSPACDEASSDLDIRPTFTSTDDQAAAIGQTFVAHARAINAGDYATAYANFTDHAVKSFNLSSAMDWSSKLRTSRWTAIDIADVERAAPGSRLLRTTVKFQTTQDEEFGPSDLMDPTCAEWEIDYIMLWDEESSRWLINDQKNAQSEDCAYYDY